MQYCKVNGVDYPAIVFYGKVHDSDWDDRESKELHLVMTYAQAMELFDNGTEWSIVDVWEDEHGEMHREEYDNSEFSIAGDVTDHRDGTVTVKMGKETDLEEAYELLFGGEE